MVALAIIGYFLIGLVLAFFMLIPEEFENGDWMLFSILWPLFLFCGGLFFGGVKISKGLANASRALAAKKEAKRKKVETEAKQDAELIKRLEERTM